MENKILGLLKKQVEEELNFSWIWCRDKVPEEVYLSMDWLFFYKEVGELLKDNSANLSKEEVEKLLKHRDVLSFLYTQWKKDDALKDEARRLKTKYIKKWVID